MLREHRARALGLPDLLNFAALVDEGVILNKDGALLAGWWYAGPDMDAASHEELAILSSQVNAALVRLGNGWMLQADAMRQPGGGYAPPGAFPDRDDRPDRRRAPAPIRGAAAPPTRARTRSR